MRRPSAAAEPLPRPGRSGLLPLSDRDAGDSLRRDSLSKRLLAVADGVAAAAALVVAVAMSGNTRLVVPSAVVVPAAILLSKTLGLYDRDELLLRKATLDEAPRVLQLATLLSILVWLLESWVLQGAFRKVDFAALWIATFVGVLGARAIARGIAERVSPRERCLLLGRQQAFRLLQSKLSLPGSSGAQLVGREELEDEWGDVLVSGRLPELVSAYGAERVILAPMETDSDAVLDLIREAKATGVKVSLLPRLSEVLGSSVQFDDLNGVTVLAFRRFGLSRSSRLLKRAFDLALAGIGTLVTLPVMAVAAAGIKLDSHGPVLFRQTRIGRNDEPFEILKFRTMVSEAAELRAELESLNEADGLFKIADDPRVTRVGRWLRRTSLDELPQLFNVLRGDMSLVGPRPLVIEDDQRLVGWHRQRLNLSPGMTGHWQVLGSSRVPLQEMVAIDYLYVVNWSLWSDMKYLLHTVPHVLRARGL